MNDQLKLLDEPDYDLQLSQWFTPPELAKKIVSEWLDLFAGRNVVEPSCGRGDLLFVVEGVARSVLAVEIDEGWCDRLRAECEELQHVRVLNSDWFQVARQCALDEYDIGLQNTPFEDEQDVAWLVSVLEKLGETVAVLRLDALATIVRHRKVWSKYHLRRLAILPRRPAFSGQPGAHADFCVTYITSEPGPQSVVWWLL